MRLENANANANTNANRVHQPEVPRPDPYLHPVYTLVTIVTMHLHTNFFRFHPSTPSTRRLGQLDPNPTPRKT